MEKLGLGLGLEELPPDKEQDPRAQRKASIEKCIQFLVHASQCRDPTCKLPSCIKMKRVLRHTRDCKLRMSGSCTVCKQFLLLCYSHAKSCTEDKCPVPVCARIKKKLREQRMQQRMRQNQFMQQRMAGLMQLGNGTPPTQGVVQPFLQVTSQEQKLVMALRSPNPTEKQNAVGYIRAHPELYARVMQLYREQLQRDKDLHMSNMQHEMMVHHPTPGSHAGHTHASKPDDHALTTDGATNEPSEHVASRDEPSEHVQLF